MSVVRLHLAEEELLRGSLDERYELLVKMTVGAAQTSLIENLDFLRELAGSLTAEIAEVLGRTTDISVAEPTERERILGIQRCVEAITRIIEPTAQLLRDCTPRQREAS